MLCFNCTFILPMQIWFILQMQSSARKSVALQEACWSTALVFNCLWNGKTIFLKCAFQWNIVCIKLLGFVSIPYFTNLRVKMLWSNSWWIYIFYCHKVWTSLKCKVLYTEPRDTQSHPRTISGNKLPCNTEKSDIANTFKREKTYFEKSDISRGKYWEKSDIAFKREKYISRNLILQMHFMEKNIGRNLILQIH